MSDMTRVRWTYQHLLHLPESNLPVEVWDGERIVNPAPDARHQRIVRDLGYLMHTHVRDHDLGEVLLAPVDVVFADEWVVQPDVLFVRKERLDIIQRAVMGPPDLVVEVVSPGTRRHDQVEKYEVYARFGVREYWLVDPEEAQIEVYHLDEGTYKLAGRYAGQGSAHSVIVEGLACSLAEVFGFG